MAQDMQHPAPDKSASSDESMRRAIAHYRLVLREKLEAEAMNHYVRLDAETGDYVVGPTRGEARSLFQSRFGERMAWTMHIGTV